MFIFWYTKTFISKWNNVNASMNNTYSWFTYLFNIITYPEWDIMMKYKFFIFRFLLSSLCLTEWQAYYIKSKKNRNASFFQ